MPGEGYGTLLGYGYGNMPVEGYATMTEDDFGDPRVSEGGYMTLQAQTPRLVACEVHSDEGEGKYPPLPTPAGEDSLLKYPIPADGEADSQADLRGLNHKPDALQRLACRHGLTRKGLCLLVWALLACVCLLLAVLCLLTLWPRQAQQGKAPVCLTPACLRAAAQVRQGRRGGRWRRGMKVEVGM